MTAEPTGSNSRDLSRRRLLLMRMRTLGGTGIKVSPLLPRGDDVRRVGQPRPRRLRRGSSTPRSTPASTSSTPPTCTPRASRRRSSARRSRGRRDDVVLATKVHATMGDDPNARATRAAGSSARSRTACGGCGPTASTSTRSTAPIRAVDIEETLGALSATSSTRARCAPSAPRRSRPSRSSRRSGWPSARHERFRCEQPPYSILARGDREPTCCRPARATAWA